MISGKKMVLILTLQLSFCVGGCKKNGDSTIKVSEDVRNIPMKDETIAENPSKFYVIMPSDRWGDYGKILAHGLIEDYDRKSDVLRFSRTGPFVPEVTCPSSWLVIVTDSAKKKLSRMKINPEIKFKAIEVSKSVKIDWHQWKSDDEVEELPPEGSPASYILANPNSPELSTEIGYLWRLVLPKRYIKKYSKDHGLNPNSLSEPVWNNEDIFVSSFTNQIRLGFANTFVVVSDRGKKYLEEVGAEWVEFLPMDEYDRRIREAEKLFGF